MSDELFPTTVWLHADGAVCGSPHAGVCAEAAHRAVSPNISANLLGDKDEALTTEAKRAKEREG